MKKWTTLARAPTPDGSALDLVEHDGEYLLRVGGRELMSTRRHASELRLGVVGCTALRSRPRARVLIGGLGLGFTLRGALGVLGPDAEVVVAELMAEVVAWNRNPAWPLAASELADPRTRVVIGDVFDALVPRAFDAIMLDADNGTTAMMTAGNRALYQLKGVRRVYDALRLGGVAVYWSATRDRPFEAVLQKVGFAVRSEGVRAYGAGGPYHTLITATKTATKAK